MLIALVGKAYTGKTAIAQELERRGFTILSFTDYLKGLAAHALNSVLGGTRQPLVTTADILANKPTYRRFIQEFGALIGYESDPGWIRSFLLAEMGDLAASTDEGTWDSEEMPNVVVDCLRSAAQIAGAREFGAKIAGISASTYDRGIFSGNPALVTAADSHPIDGALDVWKLDTDYLTTNHRDVPISVIVDSLLFGLENTDAAM